MNKPVRTMRSTVINHALFYDAIDVNEALAYKSAEIEALKKDKEYYEVLAVGAEAVREAYRVSEKNVASIKAEVESFRKAEKEISDAYLRVRALLNAYDTKHGGVDRYEVTENKIKSLLSWAREARIALEHCKNRPHEHNPLKDFTITRCEVIDRVLSEAPEGVK